MKKIDFLILLIVGLASCDRDIEQNPLQPINSLENYKFWGEAHNSFLQVVVDSLDEYNTKAIGDEDAKPNYDEIRRI